MAATLAFGVSSASATDVLTQNWEGGLGSWTVTGDFWHVQANPQLLSVKNPEINPTLVTLPDSGQLPAAFDGTRAAWFGDPASGTFCGGYNDTSKPPQTPKNGCTSNRPYAGTLESPSFSLTGASSAIVHFHAWWEIEAVDADQFDVMQVEYSINGGTTWNPAGKLNPASNPAGGHDTSYSNNGLEASPGWKEYLVDLSPAIGQPNVKIRFNMDTRDSLYQGFRGWLVDAVRVSTPYDAAPPAISSVESCVGSPLTIVHGSNFVLNSSAIVDGTPEPAAAIPSSDRIELAAVAPGDHTVQVKSPNGALSNTFPFKAGVNCPHPTGTAVSCNYIFATFSDTCTATVGDAGPPPRTSPTGSVTFTSTNGGVFSLGNKCSLTPNQLGVASCSVQFIPPAAGFPAIDAAYSGDAGHSPSKGTTTFKLLAFPDGLASDLGDFPFSFYAAQSGPPTGKGAADVNAFAASVAKKKKKVGTKVHFKLKAPALMTFKVQRVSPGRVVKHGKKVTCKALNKKNKKHKKCIRYVTLKGSFTITGKTGVNTFLFRGRIGGKTLKPGTYRLVGTPSIGNAKGKSLTVAFRIKKR